MTTESRVLASAMQRIAELESQLQIAHTNFENMTARRDLLRARIAELHAESISISESMTKTTCQTCGEGIDRHDRTSGVCSAFMKRWIVLRDK